MRVGRAILVIAGLGLVASACGSITGGNAGRRVVGIIEWSPAGQSASRAGTTGLDVPSRPEALVVPDTVSAGTPFMATITTAGPNGCWRASDVERVGGDMEVTLTPYDIAPDPEAICPQAPVLLPRTLELRFDRAGVAVVRLEGRKVAAGEPRNDLFTTVERRIVVR